MKLSKEACYQYECLIKYKDGVFVSVSIVDRILKVFELDFPIKSIQVDGGNEFRKLLKKYERK